MNEKKDSKLGSFLSEVSNWKWDEFCLAENNPKYTTNEAVIFAVIRACVMEKMEAIKLALNRIDGKLKTPVRIEYPKIFYIFPNALQATNEIGVTEKAVSVIHEPEDITLITSPEEIDLPSLSLRQTVAAMGDEPRETPAYVMEFATQTQQWLKNPDQQDKPDEIPHVKSVVAAHLLHLAQNRNMDALNEVFDQIDGKLVETIQLLGEDMYIVSYSLHAPEGAYLNDDGIMQLDAHAAQDIWAKKLAMS